MVLTVDLIRNAYIVLHTHTDTRTYLQCDQREVETENLEIGSFQGKVEWQNAIPSECLLPKLQNHDLVPVVCRLVMGEKFVQRNPRGKAVARPVHTNNQKAKYGKDINPSRRL